MARIGIVGATGAVGRRVMRVLERRDMRISGMRLFASRQSAGSRLLFADERIEVEPLSTASFSGLDYAIFCAGSSVSREFAKIAVNAGCVVIDNSPEYRLDKDVPLVVPEINAYALRNHQGIVANPNCTTAITLMALAPLHRQYGLLRFKAHSCQAVSGIGRKGLEELDDQMRTIVEDGEGQCPEPRVFPHRIAFNVIPQVDDFLDSGYTKEEMKMQNESRKILEHPGLKVSARCFRVPVHTAHTIDVMAVFERPITAAAAHSFLLEAPGVKVLDDPQKGIYPTPLQAEGRYDCLVGLIRNDQAFDNAIDLVVSGDQLLKGAALNAVQILEKLL